MTKSILIETCRCKLCTIKTFWLVVCTSKMKWNRLVFICSLSPRCGWNLVKQSDAELQKNVSVFLDWINQDFACFVIHLILLELGIFVTKTEIKLRKFHDISKHFVVQGTAQWMGLCNEILIIVLILCNILEWYSTTLVTYITDYAALRARDYL